MWRPVLSHLGTSTSPAYNITIVEEEKIVQCQIGCWELTIKVWVNVWSNPGGNYVPPPTLFRVKCFVQIFFRARQFDFWIFDCLWPWHSVFIVICKDFHSVGNLIWLVCIFDSTFSKFILLKCLNNYLRWSV